MNLTTWSPSRLFKYEECPRKAKYAYIDRIPEGEKSPALVRGEELHGHLENYIAHRVNDLHEDVVKMVNIVNELREKYKARQVYVEYDLAINRQWVKTTWLAPDVWARFKIDVLVLSEDRGRVIDWKTGRYKPDGEYSDQLNAYSTAVLSTHPQLNEVTSCLLFVDHTDIPVERPEGTVKRDGLVWAQEYWNDRAAKMERDTIFEPRPSLACRWCPYTRNKNGPCEY